MVTGRALSCDIPAVQHRETDELQSNGSEACQDCNTVNGTVY
jgi:hypothetical protein